MKRRIIDNADQYKAKSVHFTMSDNPSLTPERRKILEAGLFGHYRQRLIDGLWVNASGLIYPHAAEGVLPRSVSHWSIGFDWAGSTVTAAVARAHCADTGRRHVYAERYHDHRDDGTLTDAQQAEAVARWFTATVERSKRGAGYESVEIIGDRTTPTALQEAFERWGLGWRDGDNEILPGIQTVNSAFGTGALTIDPGCVGLRREIDEYSWDASAQERGEDRPQAGAVDHGLDALRYAEHTRSPVAVEYRWT